MPNILDVFKADAYSCASMTDALLKLPYTPTRLESLFAFQGINTTTVEMEEKAGLISLIPAKTRGAGGTSKRSAEKRKVRILACAHLPFDDHVDADDVLNVRRFGTADALETINDKINEKMEGLRGDHAVTHEYQRIGAIQGRVLDADGATELYNIYTEFGLTRKVFEFELDDDLTDVKRKCSDVSRYIQLKLGGAAFRGITAQCGDGFWDMLIQHKSVKHAYERAADNQFAREDQRFSTGGFQMGQIYFENYRGKVGDVDFIDTESCAFYPEGVPNLFKHFGAPANWVETAGTTGLAVYAKQVVRLDGSAVDILSQSNPLIICRRPEALCGGHTEVVAQT